jgi:hypothetical protein
MSYSSSISGRILSCDLESEDFITSTQLATSQLVQSFCAQATDGSTLCAMMGELFFSLVGESEMFASFIPFYPKP